MMGELLFYSGVVLMACAAVGAVVAGVVSHVSKKRLQDQLDIEYGKLRDQNGR